MSNLRYKNIIGDKYNKLTIIKDLGLKDHRRVVLCKCDCGGEVKTLRQSLVSGDRKSCGCNNSLPRKHGHSMGRGSKLYNIYYAMISRCYSKKDKAFRNYGGRGIKVCNRWLGEKGFINFLSDMGEIPPGLTLDRIDNNGNYEPSNCRWATWSQQHSNRRAYSSVGLKGVSKHGKGFRAQITINKKNNYIGYFKTAELASLAYETCKEVILGSSPI